MRNSENISHIVLGIIRQLMLINNKFVVKLLTKCKDVIQEKSINLNRQHLVVPGYLENASTKFLIPFM